MAGITSPLSTVIIGSFGMHMDEIVQAANVFQGHGIEVLSPPGLTHGQAGFIDGASKDFLVLEADEPVDPKTLQDCVIEKMRRASFVYWVNPCGYVGTSATWEFGNANSIRRDNGGTVPVYAWHRPNNPTLALYLEGKIFEPEALCKMLADTTGKRALESAMHLFFDIDDTLIQDQSHLQAAEHAGTSLTFQGVLETLSALQARNYILHVLSRGERREQVSKLVQMDAHKFFSTIHIEEQKSPETYQRIADELGLDPAVCWMIGNSIIDDINPAIAAGWGAVHVYTPVKWQLEQEELASDSIRFRIIKGIAELQDVFKDNARLTTLSDI